MLLVTEHETWHLRWPFLAFRSVLPGAQVKDDAGYFRRFRVQPINELAGRHVPVAAIFQGNPESAIGNGVLLPLSPTECENALTAGSSPMINAGAFRLTSTLLPVPSSIK